MKFIIYILIIASLFSDEGLDDLLSLEGNEGTEVEFVEKEVYIKELIGEAFIEYGENYIQLIEEDSINEGDTMITLEQSRVEVDFDRDISIIVGEKSKVKFITLEGKVEVEEIESSTMELLLGKVYSEVRRKLTSSGKFEVKSGSVVAGVRGTKFTVYRYPDGSIEVKVFEGTVLVVSKGEQKLVSAMEVLTIDRDGNIGPIRIHTDTEEVFTTTIFDSKLLDIEKTILDLKNENFFRELDYDKYEEIHDKAKEKEDDVEEGNDITIKIS